jgi:hypothetical protein
MNDITRLLKRYPEDVLKPGTRAHQELKKKLSNPLHLTSLTILNEDHPLKIQGYIVLDAFESVTNGMEDPQAFVELQKISDDSVFYPWKLFILGLKAFYSEMDKECEFYLRQIESDSALYPFCQDFLMDIQSPQKKFFQQLWSIPTSYKESLEQIESTAYPETQDYYFEAIQEASQCWKNRSEHEKIVFCQWLVGLSEQRGIDLKETIKILVKFFGRYVAQQGAAYALVETSLEPAFLFFARSLLEKNDPVSFEEHSILRELFQQVKVFQEVEGIDQDFEREWIQLKPQLSNRGLHLGEAGSNNPNKDPQSTKTKKCTAQLELFAS